MRSSKDKRNSFVASVIAAGAVSPAELAGRVAREGELVALSQLLARAGIPGTPPAEWELPEYYR